ncbi:hypothetical protein Cgig2_000157 [Carnegiea gigantea]|uniref:Uncharacterized protein n=1 Tax=Carnegiea gigantea TaxID=171969 RepID=A0A9Q1JRR5_9CARY|nr:hypothetical protein Cgig2_000157 [Carnegiea gigantea]
MFQFRQSIKRLPVTRSTPFLLWSSHRFYHLGHEFRVGFRPVIFPYVVMEVVSLPRFLLDRFPKRIPDRLPIIPIGKLPPARLLVDEKKFFTVDFFSIAVCDPSYCKHMLCQDMGTICADLHDHRVEKKPYAIIKGRPIDRYTFGGQSIHSGIHLRDHETIPRRQKRVGAPGKTVLSATTSKTGSTWERPLFLSTTLPELLDAPLKEEVVNVPFEEELVNALSEEELVDASSEEELVDTPSLVELVLVDTTSALGPLEIKAERRLPSVSPYSRGRLGLGHSSFLNINYAGGSYVNLQRIRNLFFNSENARGGRTLTGRPRGGAGLKYRHCIGNPFGLPKLIL